MKQKQVFSRKAHITAVTVFILIIVLLTGYFIVQTKTTELRSKAYTNSSVPKWPISGSFIPLILGTQDHGRVLFTEMKDTGIDTWITGPTFALYSPCDATNTDIGWSWTSWEDVNSNNRDRDGSRMLTVLQFILDEAQQRNSKVYIGLSGVTFVCAGSNTGFNDALSSYTEYAVGLMLARFGGHPAFAGWYLGDEPYLAVGRTDFSIHKRVRDAMYRKTTAMGKTPKPLLAAPYIYPEKVGTPVEFALALKNFLDQSGVDIVMIQDGVGAYSTPVFEGAQYSLLDYYREAANKIGRNRIWTDTELFAYCPPFQNPNYCDWGEQFQGASIARVKRQIAMSPDTYVSKRVMYSYDFVLSKQWQNNEKLKKSNRRYFDAYTTAYSNNGMDFIIPASYTFGNNPPSPSYPDSGNELFDGNVGDIKNFRHPAWVGVNGTLNINFTFTQPTYIYWMSFDMLHEEVPSIRLPTKLKLECYNSGSSSWVSMGSWDLWGVRKDRNFVFSNTERITANNICTQIRATLDNNGSWTFLDEVEIIGKNVVSSSSSSPTPTNKPPAGTTVYPLRAGSVKPESVKKGQTVSVSCDYGKVIDCIAPSSNAFTSCRYTTFDGTAAKYDCTVKETNGSFPVYCNTIANTASRCAAVPSRVGAVTISQQGTPTPKPEVLWVFPWNESFVIKGKKFGTLGSNVEVNLLYGSHTYRRSLLFYVEGEYHVIYIPKTSLPEFDPNKAYTLELKPQ